MQPFGLGTGRYVRRALTFLLIAASQASAQRAATAIARVVVLGQPDSSGMSLTERLIDELIRADNAHQVAVIPFHDIKSTYEQGLDLFGETFRFPDMWEFGRLLRADVVVGLVPDTAARPRRVNVMVGRSARAHLVGSWVPSRAEPSVLRLVTRIRQDSAFANAVAGRQR